MEREYVLLKDVIRISEELIGSREYKKILAIIVDSLGRLTGADRSCVMIENQQGQFVIKAGFPAEGHGVDMVVTPTIGEEFLRSVTAHKGMVIVDNPEDDKRTEYMKGLASNYNLAKIVFIPLMYRGESLGVLTLDFCRGHEEMHLPPDLIRLLANLASEAIGNEYERRRIEAKIKQMERASALGEEQSGIAHKFRNAATSIGGFARRAMKALDEGRHEDVKRELNVSIRGVEELEQFTGDLLRFANPGKIYPEPVRINELVKEKVLFAAESQAVEWELDPELDMLAISLDPVRIGFAIMDLIRNAVQAMRMLQPEYRWIKVKTKYSSKRGCVVIEYTNNGEKIPEHEQETIFSPFFTTKSDGTGLGLPDVEQTVNLHGGQIKVIESTEKQTVFRMTLPL